MTAGRGCSCVEDVVCGHCMTGGAGAPQSWKWTCEECGATGPMPDDLIAGPVHDCKSRGPFDVVARLLVEPSSPPADDVREALAKFLYENEAGSTTFANRYARHQQTSEAILSRFEVRLRGTVTDAEVEAAARSLASLETGEDWPSNDALGGNPTGTRDDEYRDGLRDMARAALEAAREARS